MGHQNSTWMDDWASFIHACVMEIRKGYRNCKNFARTPPWLAELYELLKLHDAQHYKANKDKDKDVSSQSHHSGDSYETPVCGSRPLLYRKSQSPSKQDMEEIKQLKHKATYFYDEDRDLAIMVSGQGLVQKSIKFKQRMHICHCRLLGYPCCHEER